MLAGGVRVRCPVTASEVQDWLDRYIEAWRKNDPELVEALFSNDAVYRFRPIRRGWPGCRGGRHRQQGSTTRTSAKWEASYRPYAVDGDRAVAVGTSRFGTGDDGDEVYHNCFLLRFADGRCAEFTEYWMLEPTEG